jgi:hypothetical protein
MQHFAEWLTDTNVSVEPNTIFKVEEPTLLLTYKMETARSSKMLVAIYQTKWHPIQEYSNLDIYHHVRTSNLTPYVSLYSVTNNQSKSKFTLKNLLYLQGIQKTYKIHGY